MRRGEKTEKSKGPQDPCLDETARGSSRETARGSSHEIAPLAEESLEGRRSASGQSDAASPRDDGRHSRRHRHARTCRATRGRGPWRPARQGAAPPRIAGAAARNRSQARRQPKADRRGAVPPRSVGCCSRSRPHACGDGDGAGWHATARPADAEQQQLDPVGSDRDSERPNLWRTPRARHRTRHRACRRSD